jgi:hypothetical protein
MRERLGIPYVFRRFTGNHDGRGTGRRRGRTVVGKSPFPRGISHQPSRRVLFDLARVDSIPSGSFTLDFSSRAARGGGGGGGCGRLRAAGETEEPCRGTVDGDTCEAEGFGRGER